MLRDYRDWLDAEAARLEVADGTMPASEVRTLVKLARERFDAEFRQMLYIALDRHEANRVLTSLELIAQQTTSLQPDLQKLREAIKDAFAFGIYPPSEDREPLEREFL
jgi:hypothetical protein